MSEVHIDAGGSGEAFRPNQLPQFLDASTALRAFIVDNDVDTLEDFERTHDRIQARLDELYAAHPLAGQPLAMETVRGGTAYGLGDEPLEEMDQSQVVGYLNGFYVESEVISNRDLKVFRDVDDMQPGRQPVEPADSPDDPILLKLGLRVRPFFTFEDHRPDKYMIEVAYDEVTELTTIDETMHPLLEEDSILFSDFYDLICKARLQNWPPEMLDQKISEAVTQRNGVTGLLDRRLELVCFEGARARMIDDTVGLDGMTVSARTRPAEEKPVDSTLLARFVGMDWMWRRSFDNDALGIDGRRPELFVNLELEMKEDITSYGGRYLQVPMSSILAGVFAELPASAIAEPMNIFGYELRMFTQAINDYGKIERSVGDLTEYAGSLRDLLIDQSLSIGGEVLMELDDGYTLSARSMPMEDEDGNKLVHMQEVSISEGRLLRGVVTTYSIRIYEGEHLSADILCELDVSGDPFFASANTQYLYVPMSLVDRGQILSSPRMDMQVYQSQEDEE